jgi:hypothetical protein
VIEVGKHDGGLRRDNEFVFSRSIPSVGDDGEVSGRAWLAAAVPTWVFCCLFGKIPRFSLAASVWSTRGFVCCLHTKLPVKPGSPCPVPLVPLLYNFQPSFHSPRELRVVRALGGGSAGDFPVFLRCSLLKNDSHVLSLFHLVPRSGLRWSDLIPPDEAGRRAAQQSQRALRKVPSWQEAHRQNYGTDGMVLEVFGPLRLPYLLGILSSYRHYSAGSQGPRLGGRSLPSAIGGCLQ